MVAYPFQIDVEFFSKRKQTSISYIYQSNLTYKFNIQLFISHFMTVGLLPIVLKFNRLQQTFLECNFNVQRFTQILQLYFSKLNIWSSSEAFFNFYTVIWLNAIFRIQNHIQIDSRAFSGRYP